ncbi:MAG: precorrin-3B C(17)-methyltransferase [Candidatus Competibacterales bacterium]
MTPLYIVGLGPGGREHLTPAATRALGTSHCAVGYGPYLAQVQDLLVGKDCRDLPLGEEIPRARLALDLAAAGKPTALLSSGDPGIYAMATVVFEQLATAPGAGWEGVEVQVIPGISALQAVAAKVGAPLACDFCAISLSDCLLPWTTIERRIDAAGQGDFAVAFYNPVSQRRRWQLPRAREILLGYRPTDTPTIIARNVTRPGETLQLTTLGELAVEAVDMLTLVLVGSAETRVWGPWLYTPRGYQPPP